VFVALGTQQAIHMGPNILSPVASLNQKKNSTKSYERLEKKKKEKGN